MGDVNRVPIGKIIDDFDVGVTIEITRERMAPAASVPKILERADRRMRVFNENDDSALRQSIQHTGKNVFRNIGPVVDQDRDGQNDVELLVYGKRRVELIGDAKAILYIRLEARRRVCPERGRHRVRNIESEIINGFRFADHIGNATEAATIVEKTKLSFSVARKIVEKLCEPRLLQFIGSI
jgi:hypothetical protein